MATSVIVGRVIDAGSGEPVAGATVMLNGGPPRSAPTQPPTAGATPRPPAPPAPPTRVLTDGQGRFAFRQLVRGNYTLSAEKQGYSGGAYGRTRPSGPSRALQLDDNESMPNVVVRVFKLATISGRVVDETGEPIVNASVRVFRSIWMSGQRALVSSGQAQTDDRGMYRVFNQTPGEYVISVPTSSTTSTSSTGTGDARQNFSMTQQNISIPAPLMGGGVPVPSDPRFHWQPSGFGNVALGPDGRWRTYATQYYPMARELSQAERIVLASGEERTGIDFAMAYVPATTITGTIVGSPKPASNWVLRLIPTSSADFIDELEAAVAVSDGSGAFVFAGIPSGNYSIQTVRIPPMTPSVPPPPPPPPPGVAGGRAGPPPPPVGPVLANQQMTTEPLLWGMTTVAVADADIAGVGVTVREGLTISGRIEFSGSKPRPDAQRMTQIPIAIEAASGRDRYAFGPSTRTQQDGRFTSAPKLPGRYFIRVAGAPAGWIVQSIQANGVDVTERPIELTSQSVSNVVITFTDLIGSVRGTLRSNDSNADPPMALLFPADPAGWREFGINPSRFRQVRVGATGEFTFATLPPGDYLIVGIKDEYSSDWQNPAYLDALARVAQRVTLAAGEQRQIDMTVADVKPPGIGKPPAPLTAVAAGTWAQESENTPEPFLDEPPATPTAQSAAPQLPTRDTRTVDPAGTASISGQVTDSDQKKPLRLARVSVRGGELSGERTAFTDGDGRYTVRGLPAGNYQVSVNKPAYIQMMYGARLVAPTAGATVKVAAGAAIANIDVALHRGGVISGIILDANGQPAVFVNVQLLTYTQRDGERYIAAAGAGSAQTDDRGHYRIFGLRPGRYLVLARPQNTGNFELRAQSDDEIRAAIAEASKGPAAPMTPVVRTFAPAPPDAQPPPIVPAGRPVALSPVLYPGVVREQDASELSVAPGQELLGINFRLDHVPASRVSGVVMGPDGQRGSNVTVSLMRLLGGVQTNVAVRTTPDGSFDAQSVPPGSYRLLAQVSVVDPPATAPAGSPVDAARMVPRREVRHVALMDLDLFGNDATNLTLQTVPPLTISGRVAVTGPPGEGNLRQVSVRLEPAGRLVPGLPQPAAATADASGVFSVTNVLPGRYRLVASAPAVMINGEMRPGLTLVSSAVAGRDALLTPFEVTGPITDAVVTMAAEAAEISGKLIDGKGAPVPDLFVVLFPTDPALWTTGGTRVLRAGVRSQPDGTFRFNTVLPREYFVAVLTDVDPLEWGTPAYMEEVSRSAIKVSVGQGEKKVQDIKLSGR